MANWNVSRVKKLNPQKINNMSIAELKSAIKTTQGALNKRLSRQIEYGSVSPTLNRYILGGRITASTAGMKGEKAKEFLREQLRTGRSTLLEGGSTLGGWKAIERNTIEKLKKEKKVTVSRSELSSMLSDYDYALKMGWVTESLKYDLFEVLKAYQTQIENGGNEIKTLRELADIAYKKAQDERKVVTDVGYDTGVSRIVK